MAKNLLVTTLTLLGASVVYLLIAISTPGTYVEITLPWVMALSLWGIGILAVMYGRPLQDSPEKVHIMHIFLFLGIGAFLASRHDFFSVLTLFDGIAIGCCLAVIAVADRTPRYRKTRSVSAYLLTTISFFWFIRSVEWQVLHRVGDSPIVLGVVVISAWVIVILIERREYRRDMAIMHGS